MKNYTIWLRTAAVFQFITAGIHSITLFVSPPPNNETEKQLYNLMGTYQFDFGAGFHRTMNEMTLALSACLCLLCLFAGLINFHLVRKRVDANSMKGVIIINLVVFGIFFVLTIVFTFLLPIIQAGLILLFLILSIITLRNRSAHDK